MSGGELPPVAASSSLIAPMPMVESRDIDADGGDGGGVSFGTQDLAMALTRSQQHNNVGGMRRTCSAPHSMDALGVPDVLAPSGGPMRRVASSVGMRRSNSFFWTPAAHHDFERAIGTQGDVGAFPARTRQTFERLRQTAEFDRCVVDIDIAGLVDADGHLLLLIGKLGGAAVGQVDRHPGRQ